MFCNNSAATSRSAARVAARGAILLGVRALIVSNMWPTPERPALGTFVQDQVEALRRREDLDLAVATFPPGGSAYLRAIPSLRRQPRADVVHAHFGLTAVPALAVRAELRGVTLHGTDLIHPRSRRITTAVLPRYPIVGVPSATALELLPAPARARAQLLPCGVNLHHFTPVARDEARRALGLDPAAPFALFPYDPARQNKRHDRAQQAAGLHPLITLGNEPRDRLRLWLAAASVVLCPSDWETFGTVAAEAAALGTAVVATPTGMHAEVLHPLAWCTCAPYEERVWAEAVDRAITEDHQHDGGREHVAQWSSDAMAERLVQAWRSALGAARPAQG